MIKEITINQLSIELKKMFNIDEKSIINPFNKIVAYFDNEIKGFIPLLRVAKIKIKGFFPFDYCVVKIKIKGLVPSDFFL